MTEFTGYGRNNDIDFGDYVKIEMHRYGVPNEFYIHKVVGSFSSNGWCETPLRYDSKEKIHDYLEPVLNVIQCGVDEKEVITVAEKDCIKMEEQK